MKKILFLLICLCITISVSYQNVLAEENDDWKNGYSSYEIALIQDLMDSDPDFDINAGEVVAIYQVNNWEECGRIGLVSPLGNIGTNNMSLTVAVQRIEENSIIYDYFRFTVKATWKTIPTVRFTDAMAIAWSDNFTQYSHNCKAYYVSTGYVSGKTTLVASTPEVGVGYTVDCSHNFQRLDYAILTVHVRKNDSVGTAAVEAKYCHSTVSLGTPSISLGAEPSITFNVTGVYDTMVKDASFSY